MKKETLEDAAKNYRDKTGYIKSSELENQIAMLGFKEGAKWQSDKQSEYAIDFFLWVIKFDNIKNESRYALKQLFEIFIKEQGL